MSENGRTADALGVPRVSKMKKKERKKSGSGMLLSPRRAKIGRNKTPPQPTPRAAASLFCLIYSSLSPSNYWLARSKDWPRLSGDIRSATRSVVNPASLHQSSTNLFDLTTIQQHLGHLLLSFQPSSTSTSTFDHRNFELLKNCSAPHSLLPTRARSACLLHNIVPHLLC